MSDTDKITQACQTAQDECVEISDGTARAIASQWYAGQGSVGYTFVSTGALPDSGTPGYADLWRDLFSEEYDSMLEAEKLHADMLGTYLLRRVVDGRTGPVDGWSSLWV